MFASRLGRRVDGGRRRRRAGDGNMGLRRAWMYLQSDAVMDQSERVIREMGVDVEEMFGFGQRYYELLEAQVQSVG